LKDALKVLEVLLNCVLIMAGVVDAVNQDAINTMVSQIEMVVIF